MSTSTITQKQIESFTEALVRADLIKPEELKDNRELVVEALKLSQSRDGLAVVLHNTQRVGSEMTKTAAMNSQFPEKELTRAEHDPIKIFEALFSDKKVEQRNKEKQAQEMIDAALTDWYYYERKVPNNQRYSPSIGRNIDKEYFLEFPYKCPFHSVGCMHRFKTPEEAQKHRYRHGA